jgi:hypothetical protein
MKYAMMILLSAFLLGSDCSDDGGRDHQRGEELPVAAIPEAGAALAFGVGLYLVSRKIRR